VSAFAFPLYSLRDRSYAIFLGIWTVDTCPKNDVILFFRKGFCAFGLGLELGIGLRLGLELREIRLYVFGQMSIRASILDHIGLFIAMVSLITILSF